MNRKLQALSHRRRPPGAVEEADYRLPWALDVDRILHSRAYTRYIDKTQVFYLLKNEHITHRVLHVQMVSRIGRTIGRELGLDQDLIEAIALGHDLGHAPFGHEGERYLDELCRAAGIGRFAHAVMSVRFLTRLEKKGAGLNLTLGALDGILCHDGESDFTRLKPQGPATFEEFDRRLAFLQEESAARFQPMSPEGCLVRLCDSLSYVGRDLEDAIEVGLITRADLPVEITQVLGDTNGKIIYRLVEDLIANSRAHREEGLIGFSSETAQALKALKDFNRRNIYFHPEVNREGPKIKHLYGVLFAKLAEDFTGSEPQLTQSRDFLQHLDADYPREFRPEEMARDCLASMTDEYFISLAAELLIPTWRVGKF